MNKLSSQTQPTDVNSSMYKQYKEDHSETIFKPISKDRCKHVAMPKDSPEIQKLQSIHLTREQRLLNFLQQQGILLNDPRITKFLQEIKSTDPSKPIHVSEFLDKINSLFVLKLLSNELVISNFPHFCSHIEKIFNEIRDEDDEGEVCQQTPESAAKDPNLWGMSICTIDGQRFSLGDADEEFCIQATSQPLTYSIALTERGADAIHEWVGYEPSGQSQNANENPLNPVCKPFNPLCNAGALVTTALLAKEYKNPGECFKKIMHWYSKMAGGAKIHFDNCEYQSKKLKNYHNWALLYKLLEKNALPDGVRPEEIMDLYLQMCCISINCNTASVIAATLANSGVCPLNDEKILNIEAIRDTLSVMLSCGQYQYSGQFAFQVGLPSKSGISGILLLVVPDVMGICLYSPRLINETTSKKCIDFCKLLIHKFNLHIYDSLVQNNNKIDPIYRDEKNSRFQAISAMLYAAYQGKTEVLQKYYLKGYDLNSCDYDRRTPLHIAASEGHLHTVTFLCDVCEVDFLLKDRWESIAKDSAVQGGHKEVANYLTKLEMDIHGDTADQKKTIMLEQLKRSSRTAIHLDLSIPKTLLGDYVVKQESRHKEQKELYCNDPECTEKLVEPLATLEMILEGVADGENK